LRGVCYPASLWIPYRELNNTSQVRRLLIMGWTKEVVEGAREIIYDFIKYEIGEDIYSLRSATNHDVWETWNRSRHQMMNEDFLHDPRAQNVSRGLCDAMWRDEPNSTTEGHPEYGNIVEVVANDLVSEDEDIAEILNLPPLEVKPELKTEDDTNIDVADEDEEMDSSCEVVNTVTVMNKGQDDEIKEEVKITIEEDKIITWRALNKENPNQGVLYEIIKLGMTITCQICCGVQLVGSALFSGEQVSGGGSMGLTRAPSSTAMPLMMGTLMRCSMLSLFTHPGLRSMGSQTSQSWKCIPSPVGVVPLYS
jgi:hypothetical protein